MFKIISNIFSPNKLGDSIVSGVDKMFLSKEERIDYMKEMLLLYQPYKLAQRILAVMFTATFLFIHIVTAISHFIFTVLDKPSEKVIALYGFNNDTLGTIVLIIISFYFAGGVIEGTISKLKKKKNE